MFLASEIFISMQENISHDINGKTILRLPWLWHRIYTSMAPVRNRNTNVALYIYIYIMLVYVKRWTEIQNKLTYHAHARIRRLCITDFIDISNKVNGYLLRVILAWCSSNLWVWHARSYQWRGVTNICELILNRRTTEFLTAMPG